jgi:dihydroorotate dehydrogenase
MPLSALALRTRWSIARMNQGRQQPFMRADRSTPVQAMGLEFPSPLVLAAGFDRHGRLFDAAARLGLGAIEAGSMNCAPDQPVPPLLWPRYSAVRRGLSLGKPPGMTWAQAPAAFLHALVNWHRCADYITLNPGPDCPSSDDLARLMTALMGARVRLPRRSPLPLVAKLPARWLGRTTRRSTVRRLTDTGCEGLLLSMEGLIEPPGESLADIAEIAGPGITLISVGGISTPDDVRRQLLAGMHLVQVHRAFTRTLPQPDAMRVRGQRV